MPDGVGRSATRKVESRELEDRLLKLGLSERTARLLQDRRTRSEARLDELTRGLSKSQYLPQFPNLCVYASGSYARGEASEHSDIDLFLVHDDINTEKVTDPRLKGIRAISSVIRQTEEKMDFPAPSNDGLYLNVIRLSEVLEHLGGAEDDYRNHFTARMLLLLESRCVFGQDAYDSCIRKVVYAYLRDYKDHADDFRPTFLVNDMLRFWRTLCLNYENRRNQRDEAHKTKQKIKNFKLGFSRLLTCFATVARLSYFNHIERDGIIEITNRPPISRLLDLADDVSEIRGTLKDAVELYGWFLEKTALPTDELEGYFSSRENRVEAFGLARDFGQFVYDIVKVTAEERGTLRYLVI